MKMIIDEYVTCSKFQKVTIWAFKLTSIIQNYLITIILISRIFAVTIDFYTKTKNLYISMQQINLYEIPEIA